MTSQDMRTGEGLVEDAQLPVEELSICGLIARVATLDGEAIVTEAARATYEVLTT